MIKRGIKIKNKKGLYIVADVDTIDGFAIIREIMRNKKGEIFYGKNIFIGLKQLDDYMVV
jgi:hypothetical protein